MDVRYSGGASMPIEVTKRLFTVHDYHRMGEAGILSSKDRVELIRGEILAMSPIGPPHSAAVDRSLRAMVNATGERAIVRVQGSVELDEYTQPQPDIVLLRPKEDFYAVAHPGPSDILLIPGIRSDHKRASLRGGGNQGILDCRRSERLLVRVFRSSRRHVSSSPRVPPW